MDRGLAAQAVLGMQRGQGNAYVSRLATSGATIARRKGDEKKPSVEESIGAGPGTATFLEGAGDKDTVALGEKGFTKRMLEATPEKTGEMIGLYSEYHLKPININWSMFDKQSDYVSKKQRIAQDKLDSAEGKGWLEGRQIPTVIRLAKDERDAWQKKMDNLAADRVLEQRLMQNFNTGTARANLTFASLARLEGMEDLMGIKDPRAMTAAIVKSLQEAGDIADTAQMQGGVSAMEPLKATESVTKASQEVTDAQGAMQAEWLGVQQELVKDHVAEIEKRGEKDRERLGKIEETIKTFKEIGGAIDVGMSAMSGMKTMVEGTSTKLTKSQVADLADSDSPDVMDKSGAAGAKKVGNAVATAMDIKIPTSAADLLETGAKLFHYRELEGIRKRLAELANQTAAFKKAGEELGILQKFQRFEKAADRYENSLKSLQAHLHDRRVAALKLGEQLDTAARAQSKGKIPKGSERFATVMTLTNQIREVLTIAEGGKGGFKGDLEYGNLRETLGGIAERREFIPGELPQGEAKPLLSMQNQIKTYEGFTEHLKGFFDPVEKEAQAMMQKMALGGGAATTQQ